MTKQYRPRLAAFVAVVVAALAASVLPAAAASGDRVDVVVQAGSATRAAELVIRSGGTVDRELTLIGGVAAEVPAGAVDDLEARDGVSVVVDESLQFQAENLSGDTGTAVQLQAMNPGADWNPMSGAGVGVALIDTGVAETPDLTNRVIHGPDYSDEGDGVDRYGHGTFMAGLIAGDGTASTGDLRHFGVAPGAHIVSVKLAGRDGATSLSKVLDAIGWVVTNQDRYGIRVLNLSLGVVTNRAPEADPLSAAVQAAWASGITVVAASGNEGAGVVTSPGRDPWVITVGSTDTQQTATTADDTIPEWSGESRVTKTLKPEVLAPGKSVVSLRAPGSLVDESNPGARIDEVYFRGSGTSMSAAMVSGAVAALAATRPLATPDHFKAALLASADPVSGTSAVAVDLAGADAAVANVNWVQNHAVAFTAPPGQPFDGMPWNRAKWAQSGWSRAKWADDAWTRAKWADSEFARAKWADSEFARAKWADSEFARAKWADDTWSRAKWADSEFARAKWADADFARAKWADAEFARAKWADAEFARAKWADAEFARAKWADADFARAKWADAEFARAKWADAEFARAKWADANFARAKWADANFARAKWAETDWARAKWAGDNWAGEKYVSTEWSAAIWEDSAAQ